MLKAPWLYGQLIPTVPVSEIVAVSGTPFEVNITLAGVTEPEPATTLTDLGNVSEVGFTTNALPPLATLAENVPVPVNDIVPVEPQAILNEMGDMLKGTVVTASPFAP